MVRWLQNLFGVAAPRQNKNIPIVSTAALEMPTLLRPDQTIEAASAGQDLSVPDSKLTADGERSSSVPLDSLQPENSPISISWLSREYINANFNIWLFSAARRGLRTSDSDLEVNPVEKIILDTIDQILAEPQAGTQLVRRMPGIIPQLLQSLRTNDFSGAELSRRISHDVVLVAEVIRMANSSQYSREEPITSIEHAVMVLGQNGLRHLITSVAFRPIIDLKSGHFNRFVAPRIWLHSEHCAIASRLLAEQTESNSFEAFLAGLVQNVGLIVALRVIDQNADGNASVGSAAFCNLLIPKTRGLSASIGREWNFPASVITAIEDQGPLKHNRSLSILGRHLVMADYLSKSNLLIQSGIQTLQDTDLNSLTASEQACYFELAALTNGAVE
jgi:HD-like signal output (HDOD) protein